MPAPRKLTSRSASALRSASAARRSYTSDSAWPSGRSSGRSSRTPAGTSAKRSSTEETPIFASMRSRSWSVADVYRDTVPLLLSELQLRLVRGGVEQALPLARIAQPYLHQPAGVVGLLVDQLRRLRDRFVHLRHLA